MPLNSQWVGSFGSTLGGQTHGQPSYYSNGCFILLQWLLHTTSVIISTWYCQSFSFSNFAYCVVKHRIYTQNKNVPLANWWLVKLITVRIIKFVIKGAVYTRKVVYQQALQYWLFVSLPDIKVAIVVCTRAEEQNKKTKAKSWNSNVRVYLSTNNYPFWLVWTKVLLCLHLATQAFSTLELQGSRSLSPLTLSNGSIASRK